LSLEALRADVEKYPDAFKEISKEVGRETKYYM
jgi:hypothetical protein